MLQLKQKKPLSNRQIKEKSGGAFRQNMWGLMGGALITFIPPVALIFLLSQAGSTVTTPLLQFVLQLVPVILVFPLQIGFVRYCVIIYQQGGASLKELFYYYRNYFANSSFMAIAVVLFAWVIQFLSIIAVNLSTGLFEERTAAIIGMAFQIAVLLYAMIRLCLSPWLFAENPRRGVIQIFERSFALTREKTKETLRFFWWAPVALVAILALVGLFTSALNPLGAYVSIVVGYAAFMPRLMLGLSGYAINILTIDKISRGKDNKD
jgi:hypothetical protein